jgi:hypothetical protein
MSFINIFGGTTVQPALISYLSINPFTANVTLSWPSQFQDVNNVVANIIDINPSVGGLSITMPDATQTSVGQTVIFNNVGNQTVSILNNTGGGITTIAMGSIYYIYLIDNTTVAGTWRVIPFGLAVGSVVTSVAAVSATTPALTIAGSPITSTGTFTFTLDADLVALDSFAAGTGIAVRTGAGTWALRSIVAGTGTTITNGNGVGGNPQIAVNTNLTLSNLTVGNLNLTGNTISSTSGVINIFPAAGQSLLLGSNVSHVTIDTNNNITNVNAITATTGNITTINSTTGNFGNLSIAANTILSTSGVINIFPVAGQSLLLGSNASPVTIDTNDNITNVNKITAVTGMFGFLSNSGSTISSTLGAINIFPAAGASLLLGSNASHVTIDTNNNITNVNTITAANYIATTSISATFSFAPIARAWVYFNGTTGVITNSFNVTSVTVNSTGSFTVNLTNPAPYVNYIVTGSTFAVPTLTILQLGAISTTNFILLTFNASNVATTPGAVSAVAFW